MYNITKIGIYAQKKTTRYKEQDTQKVAEYLDKIKDIPKENIAYIDETGIDTYLMREHGYSKRGEKIHTQISGKKYKRASVVAAKMGDKIIAPLEYEETMNFALFENWFENRLLRDLPKNSTIVMDNAAFHRKKPLDLLAKKQGHEVIFLPPYSPDLNPIEKFWAWLKRKLKRVLKKHLSFDSALSHCFQHTSFVCKLTIVDVLIKNIDWCI